MKPGQQGGGQGSSPPSGDPKDGSQGQGPRQRDQTPEGAGQAPTQPSGRGNPDDPSASNDPPHQGTGRPPEYDTERLQPPATGSERWGDLPEREREIFSNEKTDDLPLRYRKWVEDFYRRVQRNPRSNPR